MDPVIFSSLTATILFSITIVLQKFLITEVSNPFKFLRIQIFLNLGFVLLFFLISIFIMGETVFVNLSLEAIFLLGLQSCFIFMGLILFFWGLSTGNASVAGVITSARVVVSVLLGFFLFNEHFPPEFYAIILMIILGVFLVSWSEEISISDVFLLRANGSGIFAVAVTLWALGNVPTRFLNNTIPLATILTIRLGIMFTLSLVSYSYFMKLSESKLKIPTDEKVTLLFFSKMVIYMAIFVTADIFITFALGESLTITETILTLESILIFLMVLILSINPKLKSILNEGFSLRVIVVRGIGVIIAFIGTLFLVSY